jgi:hypothetical protein
LSFPSLTLPVIVTVARGGLSIFSTGEASSEVVGAGAGVGSGVDVGGGSRVGAAAGEVSGMGLAVGCCGAPVEGTSAEGVAVEPGDCSGLDVGGGASGDGVACGFVTEASGDKDGVAEAVVGGSPAGVAGVGTDDGASAGGEAAWAATLVLSGVLPVAVV